MTWDIGACEYQSAGPIPIPPDPLPIPIPTSDVVVKVDSASGYNKIQVVQRRKANTIVEVHVNKGTTVKLEIV